MDAATNSRVKSCTSCRQVKLRCDAKQTFPAACSRCTARQLDCRMDSVFKRIPTRGRVEELTNRIRTIEKEVSSNHGTEAAADVLHNLPVVSPESSHSPRSRSRTNDQSMSKGPSPSSTVRFGASPDKISWCDLDAFDCQGGSMLSWTIGDITVERAVVAHLFRHFDRHHYRHIPIFEPSASIDVFYQNSPLLFWTIILIACRYHPSYPLHSTMLAVPYKELLGSNLVQTISTVQSIQALIIICVWPIPTIKFADDPSWNLCGVAMNAAMQLGLHQPRRVQVLYGFGYLNLVESSLRTRTLTWLALFQICTWHSTFLGLPPHLSSNALLSACDCVRDVPRSFIAQTAIQRHIVQYTTSLNVEMPASAKYSLIQMFDGELDRIRADYRDAWCANTEISLQSAKLYLYGIYFVSHNNENTWSTAPSQRSVSSKSVLCSGMTAAVSLIYSFSCLDETELERESVAPGYSGYSPLLFYPKHYFTSAFFAVVFLLKYLAIYTEASDSDTHLARNHIAIVHRKFTSLAQSLSHLRAARTIEILGRMPIAMNAREKLHVNTRLGASLLFDALWTAAQIRNRPVESAERPLTPTLEADLETAANATAAARALPGFWDTQNHISEQTIQQADPKWSFPWGLWDDQLFDAMAFGQNVDFDMTGLQQPF